MYGNRYTPFGYWVITGNTTTVTRRLANRLAITTGYSPFGEFYETVAHLLGVKNKKREPLHTFGDVNENHYTPFVDIYNKSVTPCLWLQLQNPSRIGSTSTGSSYPPFGD